jgi:PAS domain S-box-containing protein
VIFLEITIKNDILIVDDEIPNLKLLAQFLAQEGCQVRPVERPQLAIDSALAQPPALILLDVKMPEMDGFEVCRRLKQDERTRDIPVIFISAMQDVQDKVRGFEAGGVDFVSKPFQEKEILARVRTHLNLRNLQLNMAALVDERTSELAESTEELVKSEAKYRSLVDNSLVGIFNSSLDGQFFFVNDALARMYDFDHPEQMLAEGSLPRWADPKQREQLMSDLREHGSVRNFEAETITRTGRHLHVIFSAKLQYNKISGMVMDVTDSKKAEQELCEREAMLSTLLNAPLEIIMLLDRDGTVLSINKGGASRFGKNPEEMTGFNIFESLPHETAQLRKDYAEIVFETGKTMHFEDEREDKYYASSVYPVFDAEGANVVNIAVFASDITEQKQAERDLHAYQERLRALASELTVTEERERRRIATELHDGAAQSLAFARIQLASARKAIAEAETAKKLDDVSQILRETLGQIREVLLDLSSPSMNEIGLGVAISEWLEQQIGRRHGLKTSFTDQCGEVPLDNDVRAMLFRNTRELLTNVVKHARAKTVSVCMESTGVALRITIEDDGVGLDPDNAAEKMDGGFGIFSIRERMLDLGGSLEIVSARGKGCEATLVMPLEREEERN